MSSCALGICEHETSEMPMIPCCVNRHMLHYECLLELIRKFVPDDNNNNNSLVTLSCPLCRDSKLLTGLQFACNERFRRDKKSNDDNDDDDDDDDDDEIDIYPVLTQVQASIVEALAAARQQHNDDWVIN